MTEAIEKKSEALGSIALDKHWPQNDKDQHSKYPVGFQEPKGKGVCGREPGARKQS